MINNNLTILIIFSILLYSCQSVNEAIVGKKRSEQSDEFLVEKKNPLTLPPDFEKLPIPGNKETSVDNIENNDEIKDLLSINDNNEDSDNENSADIENSILRGISKLISSLETVPQKALALAMEFFSGKLLMEN